MPVPRAHGATIPVYRTMASTGNISLARNGLAALEVLRRNVYSLTEEDLDVLAKWPGWGPLAPAFDPEPPSGWGEISEQLADLLDSEAYDDAKLCVDNSFYTPAPMVAAMFEALSFTGIGEQATKSRVRALEPGCGSGVFMGAAPEGWHIEWTGIEADKTSAAIASALHPESRIVRARLEKTSLPADSFDLAIGNVPFSSQHIHDPAGNSYLSVHNYFIVRALEAVHEGGYLAFIVSRFAMDGRELLQTVRGRAAFVGAVRLPSGALRSGGTEVVADIVFLRKGTSPSRSFAANGSNLIVHGDGTSTPVSSYWGEHPDHVAGTMVATRNYHNPLAVKPGADPDRDLARAFKSLSADLAACPWGPGDVPPGPVEVHLDEQGHQEGSFVLEGDKLSQVSNGKLVPVPRAGAELKALVELRDAARGLLELESDVDLPDSALDGQRANVKSLYDSYVARYGPLNRGTLHEGPVDPDTGMATLSWRRPSMGGFRRDPGYITVLALEHYDQDTGEARPAAVLLGRVNRRPEPVGTAETPEDALAISLGETGRLDLARVAGLLGLDGSDQAVAALGDLVYCDPARAGAVVTARDYLSGNVRAKLALAEQAAASDRRYQRNVEALRAIAPPLLGPLDIVVHLGAPWVPAEDIETFLEDVVGRAATVEHTPVTATWHVSPPYGIPAAARTTWGTGRLDAYQLVEHALNGRTPVVYDEVWDDYGRVKKVRNQDQTLAAIEKLAALDDRFGTWVWESKERSDHICAEYNRLFNSHVLRKADGSHLTFPGLASGTEPWPWQRDVVDRIVSTAPGTFCAHDVGLGKTLTMILAAHTLKRFRLANKPLIIVPNHLLEQIAREAAQTFPLNKYLIAGKEDLAGDNRRLFAARCATEDWDAVVMTHQGFTSLPVHPATETAWLNEQKSELEDFMRSDKATHQSSKDIARALRSLQSRLEQLRENVSDPKTILFDQLGIDWIAVDECSAFRRLPVNARSEGFSLGSSKRATDLYLKVLSIAAKRPGQPCLALFSGTPWNNTLAEVFVWQTYLQLERLKEIGVANFPAWAATFIKRETRVEVAPDGSGFRLATRPVGLQNLPELRTMFSDFMDIVHADATGIERPDAVIDNVVARPTDAQVAFVKDLVRRADNVRSGGADKEKDNMLVICGDGRKVALDPMLVGLREQSPKLVAVADKVAEVYDETVDWSYSGSTVKGAFQVVFCDQGTPGGHGAQSYGRLREMLVERGVPVEKIRWAHEANTDKAKAALFSACRDGRVAVLITSTDKAGLGTNIQTRLCAIHHADAPWLPSLVVQRDGRGIRYGNLNSKVRIFRYVTEGTFDAYMWQALERKARGFQEISRADSSVREIDDIGEAVLSYGEVKALATGNLLVLRQAEISAVVKRLRTLKAVDSQGVAAARRTIPESLERAKDLADRAQRLEELAQLGLEIGEAEEEQLARLARAARERITSRSGHYIWYGAPSAEIGPVRARVGQPDGAQPVLELTSNYEDLYSQQLRERAMRKSDETATKELIAAVKWFLSNCAELATQARVASFEAARRAEDAKHLVNTYVFSQEAELREAERQLQEVNMQISEIAAADNTAA